MTDRVKIALSMGEEPECFAIGDTVETGCDVEIDVQDKIIIIPKGTKALMHIAETRIPYEGETDYKPAPRLFFGFKTPHYDCWSMYWAPIRSRKVLTEKAIDIFRYDDEKKFLSELHRRKRDERYFDNIVIPRF